MYYGLVGLFVGAVFANAVMALLSFYWFLRAMRQESLLYSAEQGS
jgi:hypothetical protein